MFFDFDYCLLFEDFCDQRFKTQCNYATRGVLLVPPRSSVICMKKSDCKLHQLARSAWVHEACFIRIGSVFKMWSPQVWACWVSKSKNTSRTHGVLALRLGPKSYHAKRSNDGWKPVMVERIKNGGKTCSVDIEQRKPKSLSNHIFSLQRFHEHICSLMIVPPTGPWNSRAAQTRITDTFAGYASRVEK